MTKVQGDYANASKNYKVLQIHKEKKTMTVNRPKR